MASEIRVNKIENRSGLGTVTFADTGVDLAGIVTATTFSGSGASLTSLPAAQLSGTLPALSAANLTSIPAANVTGTLPAISGANLTNLPAANVTGTLPAISGANLTNLTAANLTGALPAISAASCTSIPAANIVGLATAGFNRSGGFGKVLQVVNNHVTATSSLTMNGNEFTNISPLNTSITPSSSSSKILVSMYMMGEGTDNDSNYAIRIEREISGSGTRLGGVDSGNRLGCFQMLTEGHDSGNTGTTTTYMQFSNYVDSPNTTSACTYKCYIRNSNTNYWYVNRTKDDPDNVGGERGHTYVTLIEISG